MAEKTVKMSTRKGNFVLLEDVIRRTTGEIVFERCEKDPDQRAVWIAIMGEVVYRMQEARKNHEDLICLRVSDFF